jgi:tetratricopeptide (TPR) repeat protein
MRTIRHPFFQISSSIWLGLFLVLSTFHLKAQESSDEIFAQANAAYNGANYGRAVELYKQILDKGQHSAGLYYNLGNAYYRLNQVAESIYFFEKAKQLAPENQDIKINSTFAQNMTIDAIEPLPQSQLAPTAE